MVVSMCADVCRSLSLVVRTRLPLFGSLEVLSFGSFIISRAYSFSIAGVGFRSRKSISPEVQKF